MEGIMTVSEIRTQFPGEWILVENVQTDQALEDQNGRVVAHSPDRDEVYRQILKLRPKNFAILYTGTMPEDAAIVL